MRINLVKLCTGITVWYISKCSVHYEHFYVSVHKQMRIRLISSMFVLDSHSELGLQVSSRLPLSSEAFVLCVPVLCNHCCMVDGFPLLFS